MQNLRKKLLLALGLLMASSAVYSEVRTCTRAGNVEVCEICDGNKCVVIVIELPDIPIEPIDPIDIGPPPKP